VKIKLDENIGISGANLLRKSGHDVATVRDERLQGSSDDQIFQVCVAERRILITLDRDFGHASRFPPKTSAGIIILELGGRASFQSLHSRLREFLALAEVQQINGKLWIVEPGRIRVHMEKGDE
jgi:predicted nuclease of predicted toxin-antitoxin system